MQRRKFLRTAAVGAAGVATTSTLAAPPSRNRCGANWRITSSFPKSLGHAVGGRAERMVKIVAEATDNSSRSAPSQRARS